MSDHFKKLERMYLSANINRLLFPSTDVLIKEGSAEISLEVNDDYFHALHAMHGAVYFKLMDDAAYFAANSLVTD
jgi:acyl-coenzyme A thioesterase PaaI-like protein